MVRRSGPVSSNFRNEEKERVFNHTVFGLVFIRSSKLVGQWLRGQRHGLELASEPVELPFDRSLPGASLSASPTHPSRFRLAWPPRRLIEQSMARLTGTLLLLSTLSGALPAQAQPDPATTRESTVQIAVMDDTNIRRAGSGFPIAENYVLTAAHLVANEDRIVAVPLTTGAELFARVVYANDRADLALLAVIGLALPPLLLAPDGFDLGQSVYLVGVWNPSGEPPAVATAEDDVPVAIAEGSVGRHTELPKAFQVDVYKSLKAAYDASLRDLFGGANRSEMLYVGSI